MLHWYASETWAAMMWVTFVLLVLAAHLVAPGWCAQRSWLELIITLISTALGARHIASGTPCVWPAGIDFTGRVALVTGASSGVGYGCAEELAMHGWTVILAGRDLDHLLAARLRIMKRLAALRQSPRRWLMRWSGFSAEPSPSLAAATNTATVATAGRVVVLGKVDLACSQSIREYAATVCAAAKHYPIGLLVNAAGVMSRELHYTPDAWPSIPPVGTSGNNDKTWKEGRPIELMLATNAVGPMLLTQLLLPVLEATATASNVTSRIINVASSCHTFLGPARSSSVFDPIQMILGLHKKESEAAAAATTGSGGASASPLGSVSVDARYRIDNYSWSNFAGYYGLSKLCVIWNTRLLARQVATKTFAAHTTSSSRDDSTTSTPAASFSEQKLFVACTHPGVIATHLYRDLFPVWVLDHIIYWPSLLIGKTWREAAQSTLQAAVGNTGMVQGGYYLCGGEYGEESGVNCLSAHAGSGQEMALYGEWLRATMGDTEPRPYAAVRPKELARMGSGAPSLDSVHRS